MKKFLKITGISFLSVVALLTAAAFIIPTFFKEDIKQAIDKTAQEYIYANLDYDENSIEISLFKDFPNIFIGIKNFSLVNQAPFGGDTLVSIQEFGVSLDIKSALSDELKINGLFVATPRVFAYVNADGKANWDIVKPDTSAVDTSSTSFAMQIDHWEITNGHIEYKDKISAIETVIRNLNHSGSGNIADIIKIETKTTADKAYINFGGVTYLNDVKVDAVTNLTIDGDKYTFDENSFKLNDLNLLFSGWASLGDDIDVDLKLSTEQTAFKNLISLIPAVFMDGYEQVEANGTFSFATEMKGKYSETSIPAFNLSLVVKDGDFKHPSLPKQMSDINFDLKVKNDLGIIDSTQIDLKGLGLKMGNNFIDGKIFIKGLDKYFVDTDLKAKINLAEVGEFYPLDGISLKGIFDLSLAGKGLIDLEQNSFPNLNGHANILNGYIKTTDFNMPIENLNFQSTYLSDGTASGSSINVSGFNLLLDKDQFGGNFSVSDFDKVNYLANLNGKIDLGKIMKMFPIEGTELSGIIDIKELKTKGNLAAIENENYLKLETSGKANISNLIYKDTEYLPYGMTITQSNLWFTPEKIMIENFDGLLGKNDMNIKGYLSNYMGFAFGTTDTILGGQMDFTSKNFDSNIFFEVEGTTEETPVEESIYIIPNNINFVLNGVIGKLLYDDLTLDNFSGVIEIKDGIAYMKNTKFKTLGADFITNGSYNTTNAAHPTYDFDLDIQKMPIKEAFAYFNVVKELAPAGDKIDGIFSTKMKMSGELQQDYYPDMKSLNMIGDLNIIEAIAKVNDIKVLSGIADKTKLSGLKEYSIKDQLLNVAVKNGKLYVKEFVMKGNGTSLSTQLNRSLVDNSIEHHMKMKAPSGALKNGFSALGLDGNAVGDSVDINFDILGTSTNPKIVLKKASSGGIKDQVKTEIKDKVSDAKSDAEARAKAELDQQKAEAEAKAKAELERQRAEAEAKAKAAEEKAKAEAKKKLEEEMKNNGVTLPKPGIKLPTGTK